MEIGRELRLARQRAGLTQAQLAELGGTSQATLSAYEAGVKTPSAATLARLLAACGMRLAAVPAGRPVASPSHATLARRGRTLAAVLDLAGRLPAKHARALPLPRIAPPGGASA